MKSLVAAILLFAMTASAQTGLPYTDDFEGTLGGWVNNNLATGLTSVRANGGTSSVRGQSINEGTDSTGFLDRAWGDAHLVCTACYSCNETTQCPGDHTDEVWIQFWTYQDATAMLSGSDDRKIIQILMFDDWNADHGDVSSNLRHAVTFVTLLWGDNDGNTADAELALNSPRRHDVNGDPIADVFHGGLDSSDNDFPLNQWNEIVLRLVTNTPGSSDGVYQLWINGSLVDDYSNMNWFGGYAGGQTWNMVIVTDNGIGPTSPETLQVYWDDITIATSDPRSTASISGASITGGSVQ